MARWTRRRTGDHAQPNGGAGDRRHDDGGPPTVAVPTVPPPAASTRTRRADPDRLPLRRRFLPRTLLGITAMVLAFSVGAGLSGAIFFSYYQYHQDQSDRRVNTLINGYKKQFADAERDLAAQTAAGRAQIKAALAPIAAAQATPGTEQALVRRLGPSLFFVTTESTAGAPSVGAAFVVASSPTQSLLLTSYTVVQAATVSPGPQVFVRQGSNGARTAVSVRTWDAARDLALIVLPQGNLKPIPVAGSDATPQLGQPVYVLSGLGSAGASIVGGTVDDVSSSAVAIDAPVGTAFQGGPVVDTSGRVLAVASRTYAPLGFASSGVTYAPPVDLACEQVLSCPGGQLSASS